MFPFIFFNLAFIFLILRSSFMALIVLFTYLLMKNFLYCGPDFLAYKTILESPGSSGLYESNTLIFGLTELKNLIGFMPALVILSCFLLILCIITARKIPDRYRIYYVICISSFIYITRADIMWIALTSALFILLFHEKSNNKIFLIMLTALGYISHFSFTFLIIIYFSVLFLPEKYFDFLSRFIFVKLVLALSILYSLFDFLLWSLSQTQFLSERFIRILAYVGEDPKSAIILAQVGNAKLFLLNLVIILSLQYFIMLKTNPNKLEKKFLVGTFYLNFLIGSVALASYGLVVRLNALVFINLAVCAAIAHKYQLRITYVAISLLLFRAYWIGLKSYNMECWKLI